MLGWGAVLRTRMLCHKCPCLAVVLLVPVCTTHSLVGGNTPVLVRLLRIMCKVFGCTVRSLIIQTLINNKMMHNWKKLLKRWCIMQYTVLNLKV